MLLPSGLLHCVVVVVVVDLKKGVKWLLPLDVPHNPYIVQKLSSHFSMGLITLSKLKTIFKKCTLSDTNHILTVLTFFCDFNSVEMYIPCHVVLVWYLSHFFGNDQTSLLA